MEGNQIIQIKDHLRNHHQNESILLQQIVIIPNEKVKEQHHLPHRKKINAKKYVEILVVAKKKY